MNSKIFRGQSSRDEVPEWYGAAIDGSDHGCFICRSLEACPLRFPSRSKDPYHTLDPEARNTFLWESCRLFQLSNDPDPFPDDPIEYEDFAKACTMPDCIWRNATPEGIEEVTSSVLVTWFNVKTRAH